jgi:hypothetical protein
MLRSLGRVCSIANPPSDRMTISVSPESLHQRPLAGRCSLLMIIERLAPPERLSSNSSAASSPLWIQRSGNDASGEPCVSIACPECLRTFQQPVGGSLSPIREARCVHCGETVYYAIVEPVDWSPELVPQKPHRKTTPAGQPQLQC